MGMRLVRDPSTAEDLMNEATTGTSSCGNPNCTCGDNCTCGPDCKCGTSSASANPCGNPHCTCGPGCTCGPDCACGIPAGE